MKFTEKILWREGKNIRDNKGIKKDKLERARKQREKYVFIGEDGIEIIRIQYFFNWHTTVCLYCFCSKKAFYLPTLSII